MKRRRFNYIVHPVLPAVIHLLCQSSGRTGSLPDDAPPQKNPVRPPAEGADSRAWPAWRQSGRRAAAHAPAAGKGTRFFLEKGVCISSRAPGANPCPRTGSLARRSLLISDKLFHMTHKMRQIVGNLNKTAACLKIHFFSIIQISDDNFKSCANFFSLPAHKSLIMKCQNGIQNSISA